MASWFAINQSRKAINQIMFTLVSCLWSLFHNLFFFKEKLKERFFSEFGTKIEEIKSNSLQHWYQLHRDARPPPIFVDHFDPEFIAVKFRVPEKPGYIHFFIRLIMFTSIGQQHQLHYYLCWCTRFYIIYLVYTMQEYNIFLHTRITCLNFIIYNSIFKTKNSLGYYNENCLNRQNVFRRSFIFIKFLNIGPGSVWNSMYSHMNHFK